MTSVLTVLLLSDLVLVLDIFWIWLMVGLEYTQFGFICLCGLQSLPLGVRVCLGVGRAAGTEAVSPWISATASEPEVHKEDKIRFETSGVRS